MDIKKLFYKLTNKKKYVNYKINEGKKKNISILNSGFEKEIIKIQEAIQKKVEVSFLHSGHLGDVINALQVIKELSKTHKCNFYLQANKSLPKHAVRYKHANDYIYMSDRMVKMILPLLKHQNYIEKVEKYNGQKIDIDLDLFRKMPMNFNLDEVRWYFQLTGIHADLSIPYLNVEPSEEIKNKIVIMRSTRKKNIFINYAFLKDYKNILFIGLKDEYEDLKKEVPNLEFHDCKDFLEAAEIIQASRFFIGNSSFGFTIAEALKVPRLAESFPQFPVIYPNGVEGYEFYFQIHFEKLFKHLNSLKNSY